MLLPLLIACLVSPGPALAATGDAVLLEHLQALSTSLAALQAEEAEQDTEARTESQAELLPLDPVAEQEIRRGITASPFLSVVIDDLTVTLSDVPRQAWFSSYVLAAVERGAISGYRSADGKLLGLFGPDDAVTVEQLAKMAVEIVGLEPKNCPPTQTGGSGQTLVLNPQAAGRWSEAYVSCAQRRGWSLFSDGSVDLSRPALRSEVVVTLLQAFDVRPATPSSARFTDVPASMQFSGFIERAAADGVVSGYADDQGNLIGKFGPTDRVNRAAMAKILVTSFQTYRR